MRMLARSLAILLASCAQPTATVVVDLATDLEQGVDFVGLEIVLAQDGETVASVSPLAPVDAALAPTRVAELRAIPHGRSRLTVALVTASRQPVISRAVVFDLDGDRVVTVVMGGSCARVTCPGAGDPATATTCAAGRCVAEDCDETCATECTSDEGCVVSALCGPGQCVRGACLYPEGSAACPGQQVCHPSNGCVDATCDCDDTNSCTLDRCAGDTCEHEARVGVACDDGAFCNGADTCDAAGECINVGPAPCPSAACDETAGICLPCSGDEGCPEPVLGAFSECVAATECGLTGERAREVTRYTCVDARCVPAASTETEACTRDTEGMMCEGGDSCGSFGTCRFSACATSGERSRNCRRPRCLDGECDSGRYDDFDTCTRPSENGATCRPDGSICQGVCSGTTCGSLCAYCGGTCGGAVGCISGSC